MLLGGITYQQLTTTAGTRIALAEPAWLVMLAFCAMRLLHLPHSLQKALGNRAKHTCSDCISSAICKLLHNLCNLLLVNCLRRHVRLLGTRGCEHLRMRSWVLVMQLEHEPGRLYNPPVQAVLRQLEVLQ